MRLVLAFAAAQSLGLFLNSAEAFAPACGTSLLSRKAVFSSSSPSFLQVSADPDDYDDEFLESLSGKNPASEVPTSDDSIEGAELTEEMRAKMRENNEKEEFGGGKRFKELLEAAKRAEKLAEPELPKSLKNPFADNPFAGIEGLDPTIGPTAAPPPSAPPTNLNPDEMTVEQQAEMFRQMMAGQQAVPPPPAAAAAAPIELPKARPPKPDAKYGRNRDADAIQNTADVYFAQLKRDSTVRGIARIRGDDDTANAVFHDPKIEELKNLISVNPGLVEKKLEDKRLLDSATEEMVAYQEALEPKRGNSKASGISYKEKLAQMKAKRAGGGTAASTPPPAPVPAPPAPEPPAPVKEPEAVVKAAEPEPTAKPPSAFAVDQILPEEPKVEPVQVSAPAPVPAPRPQQPTITIPKVTTSSSSEVIREGVRTLQGLLIKHRGGPGFGAGGLKGNEIAQYEELMGDISALLKAEAMSNVGTEPPPPIAQAPPAPVAAAPAPAVPSASGDLSKVESILAALDGAILMYRNSPAELKPSVLATLRAALLAAVDACTNAMTDDAGVPASTAAAGAEVEGMLACVEGATLMYRNSPPELQIGVLTMLRAALLSAVNTCNKVIADGEVENVKQYQEATATMDKPAPVAKPTQFYEAQVGSEQPAAAAAAAVDENTQKLEKIYNSLQGAAGDGKMGLRSDLSAAEATELADGIAEMRAIMMEELANGIPEATSVPLPAPTPVAEPAVAAAPAAAASGGTATMSRYQQMLAKAKAEREAEVGF